MPEEGPCFDASLDDAALSFAPFVPFFDPRLGLAVHAMEVYLRLTFLKFRLTEVADRSHVAAVDGRRRAHHVDEADHPGRRRWTAATRRCWPRPPRRSRRAPAGCGWGPPLFLLMWLIRPTPGCWPARPRRIAAAGPRRVQAAGGRTFGSQSGGRCPGPLSGPSLRLRAVQTRDRGPQATVRRVTGKGRRAPARAARGEKLLVNARPGGWADRAATTGKAEARRTPAGTSRTRSRVADQRWIGDLRRLGTIAAVSLRLLYLLLHRCSHCPPWAARPPPRTLSCSSCGPKSPRFRRTNPRPRWSPNRAVLVAPIRRLPQALRGHRQATPDLLAPRPVPPLELGRTREGSAISPLW